SASASSTPTLNQAAPSFSGLSAPTMTYGTAATTVSGHLDGNAGGQPVPAGETVQVTLNGVNQGATLDGSDNFSTTFDTSALDVAGSPYTIGFSYAGDANFTRASASSTLTVNQAAPSFSGLSAPTITYGTASTTISGHLDANAGQQAVPAGETVQVTVNGVNQTATLDSNDDFSTSFDTSALAVAGAAYGIGFAHGGDAN